MGKNKSKKPTPFDNPTVETATRRAPLDLADISNPGPKHEAFFRDNPIRTFLPSPTTAILVLSGIPSI
jgi:hypothetical protein